MMSVWVVALLLLTRTAESARILVFQPTPAKGHIIVTDPLFEELAARGHHLTVVTSFPHTPAVPNLEEIDVSVESAANVWVGNLTVDTIKENMPNQFWSPVYMAEVEHGVCAAVYSSGKISKLLNSRESYDMVITEIFTNDCFVPFASKFKAPLVSVVTSVALPWTSDRVGLPDNPTYVPNYYVDVGSQMSFSERVYNTLFLIYTKLLYNFVIIPKTQNLVNEYFGSTVPPIADIVRNTSMVLINSHFSLSSSRPLTPNVIEIGGIHIRNTTMKVPQDLQDILDRSSQGVVVVSFGTLVRIAALPGQVIKTFLSSFSKIPQTVIFKYEGELDELGDIPKNVIIRKWLPQRDIIGHKNVKAMFVHGGLASTMEAVSSGKPMIGMPFFADQFLNIKTITKLGAGVMLGLDQVSENTLDSALHQVLNDPKFAERASQMSRHFLDRPMTPLQTAVYWVEYVLRHRGAPHLRPASVDLALGQYLLLDVAGVLFSSALLVLYTSYFVLSRLLRIIIKDKGGYTTKKND